jgi:hypothetical protein
MGIKEQVQIEETIKSELEVYDAQQIKLAKLEDELNANSQFAQFIEARKSFAELEAKVWKHVEEVMIENNISTIKTDKLTLSIVKRVSFDIDQELLPKKYYKTVPDTTKIAGQFKLHGNPVAGTSPKYKQYLQRRIK